MRYDAKKPFPGAKFIAGVAACILSAGCASTGPSSPSSSTAKGPSRADRSALGIEARSITPRVRKERKIPDSVDGVLVSEVLSDGPAAVAGIRPDDVVLEIGTSRIRNVCDFVDAAYGRPPGPVEVVFRRRESKFAAETAATVVAAAQDEMFGKACRAGSLGGCFRQAWSLAGSSNAADRGRSLELYASACAAGSGEACAYHGLFRMRDGDRESVAILERSCELGSGGGCANDAFLHATGKFVTKDDRRAAALYTKSCDLGDAQGCYNAGLMAEDGRGVARDPARAAARYQEGCEMGSPAACTNLGFLHEHGHGVRKDPGKAVALYQRGCDGSSCQPPNRNGCVNLGRAYRDGIGGAKDLSRAASIFRNACDREIAPDDVGAESNRSRACSLLGALYIDGDGVEKDASKALNLSELGCDRGDSFGCFNAAAIAGSGPGADAAKAASFLQRACDGGDGEGCFDLGVDYERGRGVSADRSRAAELFRKSCELGFKDACAKKGKG